MEVKNKGNETPNRKDRHPKNTKGVTSSRDLFFEDILEADVNKPKRKAEVLDKELILSKKNECRSNLSNILLGPILTKRFKSNMHACPA